MALASFRNKHLEELFIGGATRRIDKRLYRRLLLVLDVLNRAEGLSDVATLPGFHPLAGDRQGHYAVTITGNYRVTFRMEGQNIHDVDYLDYH
jgi:proteic killer suppression protein